MKILLSFTGYHDPFAPGLVGEEETAGPILTLASAKNFDSIVLFSTPNTATHTEETVKALADRLPSTEIEVIALSLNDPTDYGEILGELRAHFAAVSRTNPQADFFIGLSSGTPQMHVCWVLLAASGEIPARLLMTRPPRFVTATAPLVKEIDVSSPEFPRIRSGVWSKEDIELSSGNIAEALAELGIMGTHLSMKKAIEAAAVLATVDVPVLIQGESGTGKELFSRLLHRLSPRKTGPFIALNCANLSRELAESLLFGHTKGAFTGAVSDQPGKFELADKGVLFLDELAELSQEVQAKLLRVLEDQVVERLGGRSSKKVDVRIIAATNKDLQLAVSEGKFRADLYYRLNAGEIVLPPLRERKSDIPMIALHLLDKINARSGTLRSLSPEALVRLQRHSWPGNIRDLENSLVKSVLYSRKKVLEADDLMLSTIKGKDSLDYLPTPQAGFSLDEFLVSVRKQLMLKALDSAKGNQSEAARLLGITPQAVHKFLQGTKAKVST